METNKIFRYYNKKQIKNSIFNYVFILISLFLAACVFLSIPQVISTMDKNLNSYAGKMNGADLKVEASYKSSVFDSELQKMKEEKEIDSYSKISVYSVGIDFENNKIYSDLLLGNYDLQNNQAIVATKTAKDLNKKIGDIIKIGDAEYEIAQVEDIAVGVTEQSKQMGYVKVSDFNMSGEMPSDNSIYLIHSSKNITSVETALKKLEKGYKYSTIDTEKKSIKEQINSSVLSLNLINTMCFLLTLFSILSSIRMLIAKRELDIAVMKMSGIRSGSVIKALMGELMIFIIIGVAGGAALSKPLTEYLLEKSGIYSGISANMEKVVIEGIALLLVIYLVYTYLMCLSVNEINPIQVLKGDNTKREKNTKRLLGVGIYSIMVLFVYSVYVGWFTAFMSSVIVIFVAGFIYVACRIILKSFIFLKRGSRALNYTINKIQKNLSSIALINLTFILVCWFLMLGFIMPGTLKNSYADKMKSELPYNYMVYSNDSIQKELNNIKSVKYSEIQLISGKLLINNKKNAVSLGSIKEDTYNLKYNIIKGKEVFEGTEEGIVVSKEFAKENSISVGDSVDIQSTDDEEVSYIVKGIYLSSNINSNVILKAAGQDEILNDEYISRLYIVNAPNSDFTAELKNVMVMNIDDINKSTLDIFNNYVYMLKLLSFVCITVAIIFSINLIWITAHNEYKDNVIVVALGVGKEFLNRCCVIEGIINITIATAFSLLVYWLTVDMVSNRLLGAETRLSLFSLCFVLILTTVLSIIVYSKKIYDIKVKSADFSYLRIDN